MHAKISALFSRYIVKSVIIKNESRIVESVVAVHFCLVCYFCNSQSTVSCGFGFTLNRGALIALFSQIKAIDQVSYKEFN